MDAKAIERRTQNLIARLSDLPPEVSAEPIYRQLKELQGKLAEAKTARADLEGESARTQQEEIDEEGLKARLSKAVSLLDTARPEGQRGVYDAILKFAELHPTKLRLGVYAPQKQKSPGAAKEGGPSGLSSFHINSLVDGSTNVWNGG